MLFERLDIQRVTEELEKLDGWSIDDGMLYREFTFEDFAQTRAFITQLCDAADELNHHPDVWFTYAKVIVKIITHDVGGLTEKDFALARLIRTA